MDKVIATIQELAKVGSKELATRYINNALDHTNGLSMYYYTTLGDLTGKKNYTPKDILEYVLAQ